MSTASLGHVGAKEAGPRSVCRVPARAQLASGPSPSSPLPQPLVITQLSRPGKRFPNVHGSRPSTEHSGRPVDRPEVSGPLLPTAARTISSPRPLAPLASRCHSSASFAERELPELTLWVISVGITRFTWEPAVCDGATVLGDHGGLGPRPPSLCLPLLPGGGENTHRQGRARGLTRPLRDKHVQRPRPWQVSSTRSVSGDGWTDLL